MTLSTSGYTVGSNQPLTHARILYAPITGTITADGTGGALAANDYTFQRWEAAIGRNSWAITSASSQAVDAVFIAAHNLAGKTIRAWRTGASRTNLVPYSEQIDNPAWGKSRVTVTSNATTAPDGLLTADKIVETEETGSHAVVEAVSCVAEETYTASCYIKAGERTEARLRIGDDASPSSFIDDVIIDLSDGTVASPTPSAIVSDEGNGWWRVSISGATRAGTTVVTLTVQIYDDGSGDYLGDGTSGIYAWGAQIEQGELSDYIQTEGSPVTSTKEYISPWITPADNSTIAIMTNDGGDPWQSTEYGIDLSEGNGAQIGIIRMGVALQMQQAVFGGVEPIGLNRIVETRHSMSETGQWLGRTIQRQARRTQMDWAHLSADWYRANFEPFSLALPQTPFGLIQNPSKMPESVAWCWTDDTPTPSNMGIKNLMQVSLGITGYLE